MLTKKIFCYINYFILGFVIMATVSILTHCSKADDWFSETIGNEETNVKTDIKEIEATIKNCKNAFSSGDQKAIDELTLDETLTLYKGKSIPYTPEELEKIGAAMSKAKMVIVTQSYAEYSYSIDGAVFNFALALDDKGEWKLLNY